MQYFEQKILMEQKHDILTYFDKNIVILSVGQSVGK